MRIAKYAALIVIVLAVVSLAMGIGFIVQGASVKAAIVKEMRLERATYTGDLVKLSNPQGEVVPVAGKIEGLIDTAEEAKLMSDTLKAHRSQQGYYTELKRDDPRRQTILNAMTMENSLNLAQLGFGVTTLVTVSGIFMVIIGLALGGSAAGLLALARGNQQAKNQV